MVTIIKTKVSQNTNGKSFVSLKLQGDPEFVQSQQTGRMYLTTRTCYVTSTFNEATANALIGKALPGTVERVPCVPYQFKVESTGEMLVLTHRYEYMPEPELSKNIEQSEEDELYDAMHSVEGKLRA